MKKILILTLAATLMSSCGVLKKYNRDRVAGEIKTDNLYGDAQSGDSLGLGDLSWRELFTDPTLQELIDKALAQNTNMKNAELKVKEVEYATKAIKGAFIPSITFTPQGSTSRPYDPYGRNQYQNSLTYGISATMGWQNINFMSLINQKRGADMTRQLTMSAKQAVQTQIVSGVATMYYTLAQLDDQLALMKQTEANWKRYWEMQKKLMEAGQANQAAVSSIEATYYTILRSIDDIEDNARIVENNLSTLLGESAHPIVRGKLTTFEVPKLITTGAPISILSRRPDVRIAEYTLAKALYDRNDALSAFYPSLTLTATGQFTNSMGAQIINPGVMLGNAMAGLVQPVFQGGRLRAMYKISEKELEIAKNDFIQKIIEAGNEVNTAMVEVRSAEVHRNLISKQVEALKTAYDATEKLYQNSPITYLNVITAHNSLISAEMEQIANRMTVIYSTIELYKALGGGAK